MTFNKGCKPIPPPPTKQLMQMLRSLLTDIWLH